MAKAQFKQGAKIGPWTLLDYLGGGGNGEVWKATSQSHPSIALKVLTRNWKQRDSEPFKRFAAEIEALKLIDGYPGTIPLIDASLETDPISGNRPWIAMPIATLLSDALGKDPPLVEIVRAIAAIAKTLDDLATMHRLYHRDIKPANLFKLDDRWSIGDFGLVNYPDKDAISVEGAKIGPQYYIAPEQLNNKNPEPGPGDVYSLAKTLWVLATGQLYPHPGVLDHSQKSICVSSYISVGANTRPIELLLAAATHPDPQLRPTMKSFHEELEAWASPNHAPIRLELDPRLKMRARTLLAPHTELNELAKRRHDRVRELVERADKSLKETFAPMLEEHGLMRGSPKPRGELTLEITPAGYNDNVISHIGPTLAYMTTLGDRKTTIHLQVQLEVRLTGSGETRLTAASAIWDSTGWKKIIWSNSAAAATESASEENAFLDLLRGLASSISDSIDEFLKRVDALSS